MCRLIGQVLETESCLSKKNYLVTVDNASLSVRLAVSLLSDTKSYYLATKSLFAPPCSNQPICIGSSENHALADGRLLFYVHLIILFVRLDHDDVGYRGIRLCFVSELKFVFFSVNIDSISESVTTH